MHLKRLELFGFKSFADRTVLDFERSLTGIVGPNGCGKSNVVDAMRWVLGEQRPTSMRGAEMIDVIFKGSASRPAMSVAEVTMVLDNADGLIEERGPEVAITRRVYRSGEGEYSIDGQKVRLKDVRGMLYDTGLGSRGYSVLEQGRIDAVLSQNPLDRRAIFEEAAGISRYRQQRSEIESRLRRVARDLERLDDVLGELKTRERSLKIQAGKAERYVETRDRWREQGLDLARHQLDLLDRSLDSSGGRTGELEERLGELRMLRESTEGDLAGREREQGALGGEVDRLTAASAELAGDLRALDERRDHLGKRAGALEESAGAEETRARELAEKLEARSEELADLERQAVALSAALEGAETHLESVSGELEKVRKDAREARAATSEQNELVLGGLHEKAGASNRVQALEESIAPLAERAGRVRDVLEQARAGLEEAGRTAERARAEARRAEAELQAATAHRAELARAEGEAGARVLSLAENKGELELVCARLASRAESLRDWTREREELGAGAQRLLSAAEEGGAAPLPEDALAGILADHLSVPTADARALDAALGARARALVVRSDEDAARALAWLRAEEEGRAELVVASGLASESPPVIAPPADERVFGTLRSRVTAAEGYGPLADLALANVWLVRDLEAAAQLASAHPGAVCVTPEGDLADALGLAGGHREVASGPVGRRSAAAELDGQCAERTVELEAAVGRLAECEAERAELSGKLEEAIGAHETCAAEVARARAAEEAAEARRADLAERLSVSEAESTKVLEEERRLREELESARVRLGEAELRFETENARLAQLETERRAVEEGAEKLAADEVQARVEWTRQREQADAVRVRVEDLRRSVAETDTEAQRAGELSRTQLADAVAAREESEALAERRVVLLERRGETEDKLRDLRARESEGRAAIEEMRRRADAVTREVESLQEELAGSRLESQRHELARSELERRADEDFSLTLDDLREGFEAIPDLAEPGALDALSQEVHGLKKQLDKLGPVNLEAVSELEEVAERLGFLDGQRGDLVRSRAGLEASLARIDAESERRFVEAFDEIRENFLAIFRKLFGGGRADLRLGEGESALDAGIDISARPPGREMLPLGLLSGGQRTLTALALLFAVFEARPSPFCVLDEVDAALDDANIARFLGMLDGFRGSTQFVLVTHNKGSMAACEVLYGVTMETRGVSRHVSVELDEVEEFVPEATGRADVREADPEEEESAGSPTEEIVAETEPVVELAPVPPPSAEAPEEAPADEADAPTLAEVTSDSLGTDARGPEGGETPPLI
jgi:chromosome segregation protein